MTGSDNSTERAAITTYVPEYQKSQWATHAEELDMSQSEFVRTMVQAGRQGFGDPDPDSPASSGSNPGGNVEETILDALSRNGSLSWDDMVEVVLGDLESKLEDAIIELQSSGTITHHPRDGTYSLQEES